MEVLLSRINVEKKLGVRVAKIIEPTLREAIPKIGQGFDDPEDVLERLLGKVKIDEQAQGLATALGEFLGKKVELRGENALASLGGALLGELWDGVRDWIISVKGWSDDAESQNWRDFINFLYIGLQPSIAEVTDILMAGKDDDEAVVALMMDITSAKEQKDPDDREASEKQFKDQIDQTSQQILNYPGRFFPFVAMHPERESCLTHVENALDNLGFVGLKLYPSLGYDLDQEIIRKALEKCVNRDAPVMVHCTRGGFSMLNEDCRSNPIYWIPILKDFPTLKVCFGHFGDSVNLVTIPKYKEFTELILELMEQFPGQVFTDISYSDDPMNSDEDADTYFTRLKEILDDNRYKKQILYGTDFHLVCMRITEPHYHQYFSEHLKDGGYMKRIEEENPIRYLGLPTADGLMGKNIESYCKFVYKNRLKCVRPGADWLTKALEAKYGPEKGKIKPIGVRAWAYRNPEFMRTAQWIQANKMYTHQQRRFSEDFDGIEKVAVSELPYWMGDYTDPKIADEHVSGMVRDIHDHFTSKYWVCSDEQSAKNEFNKLFSTGNSRIADIGRVAHKYYRLKDKY